MAAASDKSKMAGAMAKFATKAGGKECTTKDMTKWCKDAGIFGKSCTSNNLDIAFAKVRNKTTKNVGAAEIDELCKALAASYKTDHKLGSNEEAAEQIKTKLMSTDKDLKSGTTKQSKTGGVDKMTDTSKYTGAHKERFDESGKGKGMEGREDRAENKGYVGNYKGEGSYGKK